MAEERAGSFAKRSLKTSAKLAGLKLAVSMMDLTTLEGKDTPGKVAFLCRKALAPAEPRFAVPPCAAVCVYPNMVRHARKLLGADSPVKVASVATGFPSGQYPLPTKLGEVRRAVADGADEIDMVIDRCAFLTGDLAKVHDEIAATKAACGPATSSKRTKASTTPATAPSPKPAATSSSSATMISSYHPTGSLE